MTAISEIRGPALAEEQGIGSLTLPGFIREVSEQHGAREALCWHDLNGERRTWTYAEMFAECEKVARSLLSAGIGKGNRVGVLISNRPEWIFSTFGASMTGAVVVGMNTFSTQKELAYQLETANVELLITEAEVASHDFVEDIVNLTPGLADAASGDYRNPALPFLRRVVCIDADRARDGIQRWDEFLALGANYPQAILEATAASANPVDDGLIFFSSGSTALPKAIQQSHRAAMLQCWRAGQWYEIDHTARTWSANGFFWSGNFAMALGSALSVGGTLVLQRYFNPDEALELLEKEKVTMTFLWPHQEARLKECLGWNSADLSSFTHVDSDGALGSHPSIKHKWRQPNGYGSTETFTLVAAFRASENDGLSHGPVVAGCTIRIVDPETGEILPLGETGEIITKGPTLTRGYVGVPPEETFDGNGFFHTGDEGYFTPEGNLFWKGRLSDIIKTGGANVSPAEIDAAIVEHPAIQVVCTVGVPHETLGELVVSCVVLREGQSLDAQAVRAFARESLAAYKVPREILFFKEEELPKTGTDKIKRADLRQMAAIRLDQA